MRAGKVLLKHAIRLARPLNPRELCERSSRLMGDAFPVNEWKADKMATAFKLL